MAKGKAKVKSDAQKSEDFKKLATLRANRALRAIEALGKLAAPSKYHYTPSQVEKLKTALEDATKATIGALEGKKAAGAGLQL